MADWVLQCTYCQRVFTHSRIKYVGWADFYVPRKPDFPPNGSEIECPECRHKTNYHQNNLMDEGKSAQQLLSRSR
jgi:hypothetical protein